MEHSTISKTLWTAFPWAVLFAIAIAVLCPVFLSFLPGLLSIAAVAAVGFGEVRDACVRHKKILFWIAGICALCFFSVIFSIEPQESAERSAKITALIALSLPVLVLADKFPAQVRGRIFSFLPYVLIVTGGVLAVELHYNFPIYKFLGGRGDEYMPLFVVNKNVAAFVLLFPVGLYAAIRNRRGAIAVILSIVAAMVIYKTESQAAQLATLVAILVGAMYAVCRRLLVHGVFAFTALLLVSLPFVAQAAMEHFAEPVSRYEKSLLRGASAAMRLENYDFLSKRILEQPVTGHGIDTTRYMTFDTEQVYYKDNKIMHPHNIYLQIWIEFGAIGAAVFLAFLAFIWSSMRSMCGAAGFIALTFFCMLMIILSISWSMWASWLVGGTILMSAIIRMACVPKAG